MGINISVRSYAGALKCYFTDKKDFKATMNGQLHLNQLFKNLTAARSTDSSAVYFWAMKK